MRIEHVLKHPLLRNLIVLLDLFHNRPRLLGDALLPGVFLSTDISQYIIVVTIQSQPQEKDRHPHEGLCRPERELLGPFFLCSRAVGAQPGADADAVEDLEDEGEGPDEDVHGGHGRLEEGEEQGAVGVVCYEEGGEEGILPGEGGGGGGGQGAEGVEEGEEARGFHR